MGRHPSKVTLPVQDRDPHLIHGSLGPPESATKRHLDRFSRFCKAHERDQQTDTQRERERERSTTLLRVQQ